VVRRPDGSIGVKVDWLPPFVAPNRGSDGTWHPIRALPAPETSHRPVDIFYTPHPDDETLSMSPLIARATAAGDRVLVVAMTDGITSSAIRDVNARLSHRAAIVATPPEPLTKETFGQARARELLDAAKGLGVATDDVFFAHLDAATSDCGTNVSVGEASDVMTAVASRFPGATHVTMSFVAERNLDHLACGEALKELTASGVVLHAQWAVSRLWWALPSPLNHWVLPADPAQRNEIAAAARAYTHWDPAHQSYAIGGTSVPPQFQALLLDPRARIHAAAAH
jgi:LmbE family N-acetylglucosaminyl deacetylase